MEGLSVIDVENALKAFLLKMNALFFHLSFEQPK